MSIFDKIMQFPERHLEKKRLKNLDTLIIKTQDEIAYWKKGNDTDMVESAEKAIKNYKQEQKKIRIKYNWKNEEDKKEEKTATAIYNELEKNGWKKQNNDFLTREVTTDKTYGISINPVTNEIELSKFNKEAEEFQPITELPVKENIFDNLVKVEDEIDKSLIAIRQEEKANNFVDSILKSSEENNIELGIKQVSDHREQAPRQSQAKEHFKLTDEQIDKILEKEKEKKQTQENDKKQGRSR